MAKIYEATKIREGKFNVHEREHGYEEWTLLHINRSGEYIEGWAAGHTFACEADKNEFALMICRDIIPNESTARSGG